MVKLPNRDREAGKVKMGCLLTTVLFVAAVYYGIDYVGVRLKAYRMQDEVNEQASFASVIDDVTIRNRLVEQADRLGIPLGTRQWEIRRMRTPEGRRIIISGTYEDSVVIDLPGVRKVFRFTFTPGANETY